MADAAPTAEDMRAAAAEPEGNGSAASAADRCCDAESGRERSGAELASKLSEDTLAKRTCASGRASLCSSAMLVTLAVERR